MEKQDSSQTKDNLFKKKREIIHNFKFDENVAKIFDDMISRSVPIYNEIHKIIIDLSSKINFKPQDIIYDLGCSTGSTLSLLSSHLKNKAPSLKLRYIGIDSSQDMIKEALVKKHLYKTCTELIQEDLNLVNLLPSKLIIMNYTLQFIKPHLRQEVLKNIYNSLKTGGCFILTEKTISDQTQINNLMTELYYDFKKRNGYSEIEISQKREALEKVLIPRTTNEQINLLKSSGFQTVDTVFKWYNFTCFLGIKQ
jgi:tRNA (cmo5U34)-methyltransferase